MAEKFQVWTFFKDGTYEPDDDWTDLETAVKRAKSISESVGAQTGMITDIKIVDTGDCTVFHWVEGDGVVFPPRV